jgi:galactose mutarotase-like enzyme
MNSIKNDFIEISIKDIGAELTSIKANGKEYLWQGDPNFWGGQAPILFPFVGRLKNDAFFYNEESYSLPQHGFFRRSSNIKLIDKSDNKLTFSLKSNEETLKVYPFEFEFITSYEIQENNITIHHKVVNTGKEKMYFSVGEHPAFKCSLKDSNESYTDCYLEFEKNESAHTHLIEGGLIGTESEQILNNENKLELNANSFDKDALVIKEMNSKKVSLVNNKEGKIVTLRYQDFPLLGIWSKPNAPFVCIEPWLGVADSVNSTQKIEEKEAIIPLEKGEEYNCSYSIEVHI